MLNIEKFKNMKNPQSVRRIVQFAFLALILWVGVKFILFVHQLQTGAALTVTRPPGVEGFLPISALISLKYWLWTGIFSRVHPASLVLLITFLVMAVLLKKGFCSWLCPIGLLSELLTMLHRWIFTRPRRMPTWVDYPLRSLKYLLLFFLVYSIFFEMDVDALCRFINSPYNKVADIKMLLFFSQPSLSTLRVLAVLLLLSVLVPYFWCRYLCPYGALLGGLSLFSLFKIRRNPHTCIDCEKCSRACPAAIQVHKKTSIFSDECHACCQCLDICPVPDTLYLSTRKKMVVLSKKQYAVLFLMLFVFGVSLARILGLWQTNIPLPEYRRHIQHLHDPSYQHNRGQVPDDISIEEAQPNTSR